MRSLPQRLLELVAQARPVEVLSPEYSSVQVRRPDLLARLVDGSVLHLEMESGPSPKLDWRMLDYYALIRNEVGVYPDQVVLYVGSGPLRTSGGIDEPRLKYWYRVVDVREFEADMLLASNSPADHVLSILCRTNSPQTVVQGILERVAKVGDRRTAEDLIEKLMLLS